MSQCTPYLDLPRINTTHLPLSPHAPNIQRRINILTRIPLHKHQIRIQPLRNPAAVFKLKALGNRTRRGAQSLLRRHADFVHKECEFVVHGEAESSTFGWARGVGATSPCVSISFTIGR
jgi:hypothetical protein